MKPLLSVDKQIDLLRSRNLNIKDSAYACTILSSISYYRFGFYSYNFREKDSDGNLTDNFIENAHFKEIYNLYLFDKKLRLVLLDGIETVENIIKTKLALHSPDNDPLFLENSKYFTPSSFSIRPSNQSIEKIVNSAKTKITETNANNIQDIESWKIMEIISFGEMLFIYKNIKSNYKINITDTICNGDIKESHLGNWLETLRQVRNRCAHFVYVWNYSAFPRYARFEKLFTQYMNLDNADTIGFFDINNAKNPKMKDKDTRKNSTLYEIALLIWYIIKNSNPHSEWNQRFYDDMKHFPNDLSNGYTMADMGFPDNWASEDFWGLQCDAQSFNISTYHKDTA